MVHHQSYADVTDQTHMRILMIGKNLVQFAWKVRWRLLSRRNFTQGKVGVVAIDMVDATWWSSIWLCQRALERGLGLWVWWPTWPFPESLEGRRLMLVVSVLTMPMPPMLTLTHVLVEGAGKKKLSLVVRNLSYFGYF